MLTNSRRTLTWLHLGLVGLLGVASAAQAADDPLTAKEYKVLLDPAKFRTQPVDAANAFLEELRDKLAAAGFDRIVKNDFEDDENRTVRFYDSPGTCRLRALGYSVRERVEGTKHKINLKFRSDSQSTAAGTDVSGSSGEAELEADITPPFKPVYSHSASETLPSDKTLTTLADMVALFPPTASLTLPGQEALSVVGNLSINERTYDGPKSDLGQNKAEFTLTLWYVGSPPEVASAEVSFKIEDKDKDGDFTTEVDRRSKLMFDTIQGMNAWISTASTTKTQWVYRGNFCH